MRYERLTARKRENMQYRHALIHESSELVEFPFFQAFIACSVCSEVELSNKMSIGIAKTAAHTSAKAEIGAQSYAR